MSDCCCLWYCCNSNDLEEIRKFEGGSLEPVQINRDETFPSKINCEIYESNYGGYNAREKAAESGLIFCGGHDNGGDYGSYLFLAIDGELLEIPAYDNSPCLVLNSDGSINPRNKQKTKRFFEKLKLVKLHIHSGVIP